LPRKIKVQGKTFTISKSQRKGKQFVVTGPGLGKPVHFGDPTMPEFPGTKRGHSFCARSSGIQGRKSPHSANFWSRLMWSCQGKKSTSKQRFFGKLR
jgi:hypothetical protein